MSAAELKELRNETKKFIDHASEHTLKMVHDILENEVEKGKKGYGLSEEQEAELDDIIALDKKGLLTYAPWEEVKECILSKTKNDL